MSDFIDRTQEKANQAQSGMWNMQASIFGLIIAAASIIAAIEKPSKWTLGIVLGLCFCGVLMLLACYKFQKEMYVRILRIAYHERGSLQVDVPHEKAQSDRVVAAVQLYERLAEITLILSLLAFGWFCYVVIYAR